MGFLHTLILWMHMVGSATAGEVAVVHLETSKPGFTLAAITQRGAAVASNGVSASAAYSRDICIAPCTFETMPGLIELYARGKGKYSVPRQLELSPGETTIGLEPGSAVLSKGGGMLVGLGVASVIASGVVFAVDPHSGQSHLVLAGAGAGAAVGAVGAALVLTNRGRWTFTP